MPNPPRDTTAGRIYNDLRALARRTGRPGDQLMLEYVLERFLFRLSNHPDGGRHFVLKGGLLLSRFGARRMTRDIDILGRSSLTATADHRAIRLRPLSSAITDLPTRRQAPYTAWARRQGSSAADHPTRSAEVVTTVTTFADPLLTGAARHLTWEPQAMSWT